MSLTSHLEQPNSPVRVFLEEQFPSLSHRNNELRQMYHEQRPQEAQQLLPPEHRQQASLAGEAIERRISWSFGPSDDAEVASRGIRAVGRRQLRLGGPLEVAMQRAETMEAVGSLIITNAKNQQLLREPSRRTTPFEGYVDDTEPLARAAFAVAQLEAAYYSSGKSLKTPSFLGNMLSPKIMFGRQPAAVGLQHVLEEVPDVLVDDLRRQMEVAANSPLAALRARTAPGDVISSVSLAGGNAIGGAYADLVVDGTLIDIKAGGDTKRLTTKELQQLMGYLLLDTQDQCEINTVGLYRTRSGQLYSVGALDFIRMAGSKRSLAYLRHELSKEVLEPLSRRREILMQRLGAVGIQGSEA